MAMLLTFEISGHAGNHSKKFPKLSQTSFSGIVYCNKNASCDEAFTQSSNFLINSTAYIQDRCKEFLTLLGNTKEIYSYTAQLIKEFVKISSLMLFERWVLKLNYT